MAAVATWIYRSTGWNWCRRMLMCECGTLVLLGRWRHYDCDGVRHMRNRCLSLQAIGQAMTTKETADAFALRITDHLAGLTGYDRLWRNTREREREAIRSAISLQIAAALADAKKLPPELCEILRDAAHGVTGVCIRERAAAAIVKRDLCPRCAGTRQELLDTGPGGPAAWGTCYGCAG